MDPANVNVPACRHASQFADIHGQFTYESIMEGQRKIGLESSLVTKIRAKAILNLLPGEKTPEQLCRIENFARSGAWNVDGSFNEEEFGKLTQNHVISTEGAPAITYELFRAFLDAKHGAGYSGIMTSAYGCPITYYQVTDGSVHEFFNVFGDCTYKGKKAVAISTLKRFYTEPESLTKEIEQKIQRPVEPVVWVAAQQPQPQELTLG